MAGALIDFFSRIGGLQSVFWLSMLPVTELRAAIPVGLAWGLPPWKVYLAGVLGNIVPIPFILLLLRPAVKLLSKLGLFARLFQRLFARAERHKESIQRYGRLGLLLFVAIPLPGTGVWTGSLLAFIVGIPFWTAALAAAGGAAIAGLAVTAAGMGLVKLAAIFSWRVVVVLLVLLAVFWQLKKK